TIPRPAAVLMTAIGQRLRKPCAMTVVPSPMTNAVAARRTDRIESTSGVRHAAKKYGNATVRPQSAHVIGRMPAREPRRRGTPTRAGVRRSTPRYRFELVPPALIGLHTPFALSRTRSNEILLRRYRWAAPCDSTESRFWSTCHTREGPGQGAFHLGTCPRSPTHV